MASGLGAGVGGWLEGRLAGWLEGRRGAALGGRSGSARQRLGLPVAVQPRGDQRDVDPALGYLADARTEDDVRARIGRGTDLVGGLPNFPQAQVGRPGYVKQHAARAVDAGLEQWTRRRLTSGLDRTSFSVALAQTDERRTGTLDDRADVGEIEVDEARRREQLDDTLDAFE